MQNVNPRYQKRYFRKENRKNKLQVIVSSEEGAEHCWINQNANLSLGWFDEARQPLILLNATNKCVCIFVVEGFISIENKKWR